MTTAEAFVRGVLFDRDGTLVHDVPYNCDPALVQPMPGAVAAVARLREAGLAVGVITNQSGIARGLISPDQLAAVNERVDAVFGGFDVWAVCPHAPEDACRCRKPAPGLIEDAAAMLGVPADRLVVIGDIGSDVRAAEAAGCTGILVPTPVTLPAEVAAADQVAASIDDAVTLVLAQSGVPA